MIHGMTGFAEKAFVSRALRLKVSIKTLNHRFFEWSYKGTPVGEVESRLRALCQKRVKRGRVDVSLEMISFDPASWNLTLNEGLLEKILSSVDKVSRKAGRRLEVSLDGLFRIPQLIEINRRGLDAAEARFLEKSFERTLDDVLRLRRKVGRETARQIRGHVGNIRQGVARIEARFRKQPGLLRQKLRKRLRDLGQGASLSEARLAEEAAFLTQRYDLTEEIVRLKTHLDSMTRLLAPRGGHDPAGKPLDFLAQELFREANTISSKSQDIRITKECLTIKNELESVRQHVQNIE
jgi:uncharacterized protein (TIGR00255 family)